MKICGIYKITNIINGKCYIGQSIDCLKRLQGHKNTLNKNKHENIKLQNSYNKHGKSSFKFEIFYICPQQDLNHSEIYFIKAFKSFGETGYNILLGGNNPPIGNRLGCKLSEEHKNKISNSKKGKRLNTKGKKLSEEHKNKISKIQIGKTLSEEHKRNISEALKGKNKGRKHSEVSRKHMSEAHIGKKYSNKIKELLIKHK